jgi:hypothetical protein
LEKNIQLITIFENEWKYNKEKIKSFLKAKLGIFETRIYARDCEFREISIKQYGFFELYHLQGKPSRIERNFGLYYNEELVGCVSYALHHRNNKDIILNRMVFKSNIQIIGGASKLLKNSIKEMNCDIITWSDNRWSNGNVYNSMFKNTKEYKADYFYTNFNEYRSKQSMKVPMGINEREYWKELGWTRIYDCGKIKWEYKKSAI